MPAINLPPTVPARFFVGAACVLWLTCLPAFAQPSGVQRATYAAELVDRPLRDKSDNKSLPDRQPSDANSTAQSLPLPPRGAVRSLESDPLKTVRSNKSSSGLTTGLASLAVVLALFFLAAWAVRRGMPQAQAKLPGDVIEVLGRTPLAGRQFAHLVRCGNKLLLVYLAPGYAKTLTEITDAAEVDRLAGICRQAHPQSTTASFRNIFQQFSREKPTAEGET